jgi:hypothetical protein
LREQRVFLAHGREDRQAGGQARCGDGHLGIARRVEIRLEVGRRGDQGLLAALVDVDEALALAALACGHQFARLHDAVMNSRQARQGVVQQRHMSGRQQHQRLHVAAANRMAHGGRHAHAVAHEHDARGALPAQRTHVARDLLHGVVPVAVEVARARPRHVGQPHQPALALEAGLERREVRVVRVARALAVQHEDADALLRQGEWGHQGGAQARQGKRAAGAACQGHVSSKGRRPFLAPGPTAVQRSFT